MVYENFSALIEALSSALEVGDDIAALLVEPQSALSAEELSLLLEAFPPEQRLTVWLQLKPDIQQQAFLEMRDESRKLLLNLLDDEQCFPLFEKLSAEELLDLVEALSDRFIDYAVSKMSSKQRGLFEKAKNYDDESVGHWQSFDALRIPQRMTVAGAKRLCRKALPAITEVIYVVDNSDRLVGELSIRQLVAAGDDELISRVYSKDYDTLQVDDDINDAVDAVIASGESAIAVVDERGVLLGRLDIVTAYAIRERHREAQLHNAAGLLEEEDLFADAWQSSKNRGVWLGINLLTAFLASWFIGLFEITLQEVVALAVLMPVVASMGGVSGSQTLTLIIRGLALGQITDSNRRAILRKELKVGAINGVAWAVVIAVITQLWFDNILLSLTIAIAIVLNLIVSVISGVWVPSILDKLKIDPALSGAVVLTTVTDIVGFVVFLGLGSLLLL